MGNRHRVGKNTGRLTKSPSKKKKSSGTPLPKSHAWNRGGPSEGSGRGGCHSRETILDVGDANGGPSRGSR